MIWVVDNFAGSIGVVINYSKVIYKTTTILSIHQHISSFSWQLSGCSWCFYPVLLILLDYQDTGISMVH